MKTLLFITALAGTLAGIALCGCSRQPAVAVSPDVTYTNLGVVEISDGVPISHALGDGRAYVVTPTIFKDGTVEIRLDLQKTNASGVVNTVHGPTTRYMPGIQVKLSVEDVGICITPRIKS